MTVKEDLQKKTPINQNTEASNDPIENYGTVSQKPTPHQTPQKQAQKSEPDTTPRLKQRIFEVLEENSDVSSSSKNASSENLVPHYDTDEDLKSVNSKIINENLSSELLNKKSIESGKSAKSYHSMERDDSSFPHHQTFGGKIRNIFKKGTDRHECKKFGLRIISNVCEFFRTPQPIFCFLIGLLGTWVNCIMQVALDHRYVYGKMWTKIGDEPVIKSQEEFAIKVSENALKQGVRLIGAGYKFILN